MQNQINRKVLLLNASYEAIGTIIVPRAVRLILKGSAEMVEPDGDRLLRSEKFSWPQPSVVRLIEYVDIIWRQRRSAGKKTSVFARDHYRCQYCNALGTLFTLTMDHILPRSRGGTNSPENLVTACFACNQKKGDRTPEEARMTLLRNPAALTYGIDRSILQHQSTSRPEWRKYLFMENSEQLIAI